MASTTLTVMTPAISGTTITGKTGVASSQTLTVQASTAQSMLDFGTLHIRVENTSTTASLTLSLGVGTEYSAIGVGAYSISIGTATTVIIGGQDFESARFQTSAETIVFTQTGAGPTSWEAYQAPRANE